jgi:hypothetical protein
MDFLSMLSLIRTKLHGSIQLVVAWYPTSFASTDFYFILSGTKTKQKKTLCQLNG